MRIFTPIGPVAPPEFADGVENALTKSGQASTSSTTLVELRRVELVPGLFGGDNDRLRFDALFAFLNTVSNKRVFIELQRSVGGNTTLFDATFGVAANSTGLLKFIATVQGSQWKSAINLIAADTIPGSILSVNRMGSVVASFNPAIQNFISIQASVVNAADTVVLDWLGGSFL